MYTISVWIAMPDDKSIVAHFSEGTLLRFTKGDMIMQGYSEPEGVYLIKSGFVKTYSASKDGNRNLLLVYESGEFIPLPWALDGANAVDLYYEAMTNVELLRTSRNKLRNAMGENTWLVEEILGQAVHIITMYAQRIQTLGHRSARGRIIAELIYLASRFGRQTPAGILIEVPITHQDIGDSISMSRETASRALELLFAEGLVGQVDHLFIISDLDKLKSALD